MATPSATSTSAYSAILAKEYLIIAVGTKNPCKIDAVRDAFTRIISTTSPSTKLVIKSYSVPSGVSDQPTTDEETRRGARNRAQGAAEKAIEEGDPCDFAVGLEGGIVDEHPSSSPIPPLSSPTSPLMWCMAWMSIYCPTVPPDLSWSFSRTGAFILPPLMSNLVRSGVELGDADDVVTSRSNSKQGGGTVGVLTNELVSRKDYYEQAIILAMVSFINQGVFYETLEGIKDHPVVKKLES